MLWQVWHGRGWFVLSTLFSVFALQQKATCDYWGWCVPVCLPPCKLQTFWASSFLFSSDENGGMLVFIYVSLCVHSRLCDCKLCCRSQVHSTHGTLLAKKCKRLLPFFGQIEQIRTFSYNSQHTCHFWHSQPSAERPKQFTCFGTTSRLTARSWGDDRHGGVSHSSAQHVSCCCCCCSVLLSVLHTHQEQVPLRCGWLPFQLAQDTVWNYNGKPARW